MHQSLFIPFFRLKWYIISSIIFLLYTLLILIYAENIPYNDDLALLSSIYDIKNEPDWSVKLQGLFAFHNEHRIAVPRLLTFLFYYAQGQEVDIRTWIIGGNALLFLILYLYFRTWFASRPLLYFVPILLIVLQPMQHELMFWGMAALQNIGVLALVGLAFYYLTYAEKPYLALLLAELAVFTSANGVFAFLVGIALLFYQRNWRDGSLWIVVGLLNAYLYWSGFSVRVNSGQGFSESIALPQMANTFFGLAGGLLYAQTIPILALLLGLFLVTSLLYVGYLHLFKAGTKASQAHLFLFGFSSFILLTIAAISVGRNAGNVLVVSRYKLYSLLLLATVYSLLINWVTARPVRFYSLFTLLFFFWLTSYARYVTVFERHSRLLFAHFFNWRYSNRLDITPLSSEQYYCDHWTKLYRSGQYRAPSRAVEKSQQVMRQSAKIPIIVASVTIHDQVVVVTPLQLPPGEYYTACKTLTQIAIYPMYPSSQAWLFFTQNVTYSASVNASYWLQNAQSPASVIALVD